MIHSISGLPQRAKLASSAILNTGRQISECFTQFVRSPRQFCGRKIIWVFLFAIALAVAVFQIWSISIADSKSLRSEVNGPNEILPVDSHGKETKESHGIDNLARDDMDPRQLDDHRIGEPPKGSDGSYRSDGSSKHSTPIFTTNLLGEAVIGAAGVMSAVGVGMYCRRRYRYGQKGEILPTRQKPYECSICGQKFTKKGNLTVHERSHREEKRYQCNICKKKFHRRQNLTTHVRTHTKEKPYVCSHPGCFKSFAQLSNFKRHERTHLGVKPYPCDQCSKRFADKRNLIAHAKKIHGTVLDGICSFRCPMCDMGFKRAIDMHEHKKLVHQKPQTNGTTQQSQSQNTSDNTVPPPPPPPQQNGATNINGGGVINGFVHSKKRQRNNQNSVANNLKIKKELNDEHIQIQDPNTVQSSITVSHSISHTVNQDLPKRVVLESKDPSGQRRDGPPIKKAFHDATPNYRTVFSAADVHTNAYQQNTVPTHENEYKTYSPIPNNNMATGPPIHISGSDPHQSQLADLNHQHSNGQNNNGIQFHSMNTSDPSAYTGGGLQSEYSEYPQPLHEVLQGDLSLTPFMKEEGTSSMMDDYVEGGMSAVPDLPPMGEVGNLGEFSQQNDIIQPSPLARQISDSSMYSSSGQLLSPMSTSQNSFTLSNHLEPSPTSHTSNFMFGGGTPDSIMSDGTLDSNGFLIHTDNIIQPELHRANSLEEMKTPSDLDGGFMKSGVSDGLGSSFLYSPRSADAEKAIFGLSGDTGVGIGGDFHKHSSDLSQDVNFFHDVLREDGVVSSVV